MNQHLHGLVQMYFQSESNQSFYSSIPYKVIIVNDIRILLIGLTIDVDKPYIRIINQTSLIPFVKQFLTINIRD